MDVAGFVKALKEEKKLSVVEDTVKSRETFRSLTWAMRIRRALNFSKEMDSIIDRFPFMRLRLRHNEKLGGKS